MVFITAAVAVRLRFQSVPEPRNSLLRRVFIAHVAAVLAGTAFLALSPQTVAWPLRPSQGAELAGWALGVVLVDYVALHRIFKRQRRSRGHVEPDSELTPRELQIVRLIAQGYTAKEIGETLCISPKTVDAHRGHILRKLGVKDRVGLTRYAIRHGFVDP